MTHRDKSLTPWLTAAELGTRMHQEIEKIVVVGDSHIGMGEPALNEQMQMYSKLLGEPVMFINGGDLVHGDFGTMPSHDAVVVVDCELYHLDYKTIEDRMLAYARAAVELDRELYQAAPPKMETMVDTPPAPRVKPTREPKVRDWEQRNRKQKR